MLVKDLIEQLQKMPSNARVFMCYDYDSATDTFIVKYDESFKTVELRTDSYHHK